MHQLSTSTTVLLPKLLLLLLLLLLLQGYRSWSLPLVASQLQFTRGQSGNSAKLEGKPYSSADRSSARGAPNLTSKELWFSMTFHQFKKYFKKLKEVSQLGYSFQLFSVFTALRSGVGAVVSVADERWSKQFTYCHQSSRLEFSSLSLLKYFLVLHKLQPNATSDTSCPTRRSRTKKARCGLSLMYSVSVGYLRLLSFYLPVVYLLHSHTSHTHSYTHTTFPPPSISHSHLTTTFYLRKDSKSPGVAVRPAAQGFYKLEDCCTWASIPVIVIALKR